MTSLKGMRVAIAGAGAIGRVTALVLVRAGAHVTLIDVAATTDNASAVAAGMLAPGLETALDPLSHDRYDLLARGRDSWTDLQPTFPAPVHRCGALWFPTDEAEHRLVVTTLDAAGASFRQIAAAEATRLAPGLRPPGDAVHLPDDWRIDVPAALSGLTAAFESAGGLRVDGRVARLMPGELVLTTGETLPVDRVVLATGGPPSGLPGLPEELDVLAPIKGQIVRLEGGAPRTGPIVRHGSVYVAPGAAGPMAGATMEAGRSDTGRDPAVAERLHRGAAALFPHLAAVTAVPLAGVRYGSPDGLPLVGGSSAPGVLLALGARRNGWLLAPLIAELIRDQLAGAEPFAPFDPERFS